MSYRGSESRKRCEGSVTKRNADEKACHMTAVRNRLYCSRTKSSGWLPWSVQPISWARDLDHERMYRYLVNRRALREKHQLYTNIQCQHMIQLSHMTVRRSLSDQSQISTERVLPEDALRGL